MHAFRERLFICAAREIDTFASRQITHFIRITNPEATAEPPHWFKGAHLALWFGDVLSEADARHCKTKAPVSDDVQRALDFFRAACGFRSSRILISCDYGASRSPALAYVCLADQLGPDAEAEAFDTLLEICPNAVPNRLVVHLGDSLLERDGALLRPLNELFARLNAEISTWSAGSSTFKPSSLLTADNIVKEWFAGDHGMFDACTESPELAWEAILEILKRELNDEQLALLAAGPQETLLAWHGETFIDRVEQQAACCPKFNHLLGGVWRQDMPSEIWDRITRARKEVW